MLEGGSSASKTIQAYLLYERARVAYLRGQVEPVQKFLEVLHEVFTDARNQVMVDRVNELQVCLNAYIQYASMWNQDLKKE